MSHIYNFLNRTDSAWNNTAVNVIHFDRTFGPTAYIKVNGVRLMCTVINKCEERKKNNQIKLSFWLFLHSHSSVLYAYALHGTLCNYHNDIRRSCPV